MENEDAGDMEQKGDEDNWETFSEKSFSTVGSLTRGRVMLKKAFN